MLVQSLKSKIYFITPDPPPDTGELCALVRRALKGGVGMVQYRAKGLSTARMVRDAHALTQFLRRASVPLVINDRVDVALAAGADGVHVGPDDMPVDIARRLMGPRAIVGVTCKTLQQAVDAERKIATYVAIGPIFRSPTKLELEPIGTELVARARTRLTLPICAIGGIEAHTIPRLAEVNPDLVAVVSAIAAAADPTQAARELVAAADRYLPHRIFGP